MKKLVLLSALALAASLGHAQCGTTYGQGSGYNQYYGSATTVGMNVQDFRRACDAIENQAFDSDKLRIAQQVARGHQLSATQVRDIMRLLTFESAKVDFAKFAYSYCADPQNYYLVNDAFTFSSSVEALAEYTGTTSYTGSGTWVSGSAGGCGSTTTTTTTYSSGGTYYGSGSASGGCGSSGTVYYGSGAASGGCGTTGTNSYYGSGAASGGCGTTGTNSYYGSGAASGGCGTTGTNGYYGSGNSGTVTYNSGTYGTNGYYGNASGGYVAPAPAPNCNACAAYHDLQYFCDASFMSIMDAVDRQTFERDKLSVAKQAIGSRWISADQVRRLMGQFTFESTKLDFAKWAYSHCWDQQNYYVVNDGFTFSSSVRELDAFIGQ